MNFIDFLLIYSLTHTCVVIAHIIDNKRVKQLQRKEKSLLEMFESGELATNTPIKQQLREMRDELESDEIVILDDDMTLVDIDRAKRKLREKNERMKELILEIN